MKQNRALIFGHNDYSLEIQKNIFMHYENVDIYKLNEDCEFGFDLSDNWDDLRLKIDMKDCIVFCVLEDMAENIFLTISLRDTFKDLVIVALAENKESSDKLTLAGATMVIPSTQTTADVIVDILQKPIVTKVLHNILYEKSDLQIAQIKIQNHHLFNEKHPADIDWSEEHGIILISIVHENMSSEFIYASRERHHVITNGDIFVVVGYEKDIQKFEKLAGSRCE